MPDLPKPAEKSSAAPTKMHWSPMQLKHRGYLTDVVQGGGKTGANTDSDPQVQAKPGVG